MASLKVVTYPNPVLSKKADPVTGKLTQSNLKLVRDMIDTMYQEDGVGLAAPQIGVSRRIIVVSPNATRGEEKVYLNPEIIESSSEQAVDTEGCLSLPNVSCEVRRSKRIKFQATDINGNKISQELDGFPARVIQHEVDHLNGILIIDKVDFNQRQTLLGAYRRL
ncbi:MAG: peptide deformylase [Candidatus Omnitrophica bacterium]|nr:peptide deformylase [Candidatus Omnitrophota bacterium]